MKKGLALILVVLVTLSASALCAFAMDFNDIDASHWAYTNVQTLVNDGTVSGYGDGSFRPNGTVTRAEFVKMLGLGSVTRPMAYADVAPQHWAYTYVMNADFPDDGSNLFQPDIPITRGLVAELLWNRGGKKESAFIPSIITSQYKRCPEAVAWVYSTGLIRGDGDGINLRLDDTLTRAEAATLIVRARSAASASDTFMDIVNKDIVKNVYTGLNLFDDAPYVPGDTMTNGEMSRAVLRIGLEETVLTYHKFNIAPKFEHEYAKDVTIIWDCLQKEDPTAAVADKTATFGDTVAALSYQMIVKSHSGLLYGDTTDALKGKMSDMMNVCLTFAKDNGIISLKEDLNAPITMQQFATLCLQYDALIGTETDTIVETSKLNYVKQNHSLLFTPAAYGNYRVKLLGIPAIVYSTSFVDEVKTPIEIYNFAREYDSLFTSVLYHLKNSVKTKSGAEVRLTYYPSLVCQNSVGYTMRVACDILSVSDTKTVADLFNVKADAPGVDTVVSQGMRIFLDVSTGQPFTSVAMSDEKAYVEQVIVLP